MPFIGILISGYLAVLLGLLALLRLNPTSQCHQRCQIPTGTRDITIIARFGFITSWLCALLGVSVAYAGLYEPLLRWMNLLDSLTGLPHQSKTENQSHK